MSLASAADAGSVRNREVTATCKRVVTAPHDTAIRTELQMDMTVAVDACTTNRPPTQPEANRARTFLRGISMLSSAVSAFFDGAAMSPIVKKELAWTSGAVVSASLQVTLVMICRTIVSAQNSVSQQGTSARNGLQRGLRRSVIGRRTRNLDGRSLHPVWRAAGADHVFDLGRIDGFRIPRLGGVASQYFLGVLCVAAGAGANRPMRCVLCLAQDLNG